MTRACFPKRVGQSENKQHEIEGQQDWPSCHIYRGTWLLVVKRGAPRVTSRLCIRHQEKFLCCVCIRVCLPTMTPQFTEEMRYHEVCGFASSQSVPQGDVGR
jgi:hypothetical protein